MSEFDAGYNLGVKEAKAEIKKLKSIAKGYKVKAHAYRHKLEKAIEALEFYADLDTGVKEKYKKARQALEKINECNK